MRYAALLLCSLLIILPVRAADVQGDLVVDVLRADNDAPIVGARVVVQDRLNLRAPQELLTDAQGLAITRASQAVPGQALRATLADGELGLTVNR